MVQENSFFEIQTEPSRIKAEIVAKYFSSWANVLASQEVDNIVYLDLFSGPGRYKDGNPSTPLLILDSAIHHKNYRVRNKVSFVFNDSNSTFIYQLSNEVSTFPMISNIRHFPSLYNEQINEDIVKVFEDTVTVPTLSFLDPWGYKGLSLRLVKTLVNNWGCDCIFFFNYRRINPGIENEALKKPISLVFSEEVLLKLRKKISGATPQIRELIIINEMEEVFKSWGMSYFLPFPFKNPSGSRTTHHLIFVSKNILGYDIMKNIMGASSSFFDQGIPSFEYNPATIASNQLFLPNMSLMDDFKEELLCDFTNQSLTMEEIFSLHNVGKPYLSKNYKKALLSLENEGKITTNRKQRRARKNQFPDDMEVKFPSY